MKCHNSQDLCMVCLPTLTQKATSHLGEYSISPAEVRVLLPLLNWHEVPEVCSVPYGVVAQVQRWGVLWMVKVAVFFTWKKYGKITFPETSRVGRLLSFWDGLFSGATLWVVLNHHPVFIVLALLVFFADHQILSKQLIWNCPYFWY